MNPFDLFPAVDEPTFRYYKISEKYDVTINRIRAGSALAVHTHEVDVLNYVMEGEFVVNQAGRETVQRRGDWIFIPAREAHSVLARTECMLLELWAKT